MRQVPGGDFAESLPERRVEGAHFGEVPRFLQQVLGEGMLGALHRHEFDHVTVDRQVGDGHVDAVHRRAGNQSDHPHDVWSIPQRGGMQEPW